METRRHWQGATPSQASIQNWWRQGMMRSIKAHYDSIRTFSESDVTEDPKAIDVPTLVMHGDDVHLVDIAISALLTVKLIKRPTQMFFEKFSHGMCTTQPAVTDRDLLASIRE